MRLALLLVFVAGCDGLCTDARGTVHACQWAECGVCDIERCFCATPPLLAGCDEPCFGTHDCAQGYACVYDAVRDTHICVDLELLGCER